MAVDADGNWYPDPSEDQMSGSEYEAIYGEPMPSQYSNIGGDYLSPINYDVPYTGSPSLYQDGSFDPVNTFGQDPYLMSTGPGESGESGGSSWLSGLGSLGGRALSYLGETPASDWARLGLGAAAFFGDDRDDIARDQLEAERAIAEGSLELKRDQQGMTDLDQMARTAMGMNILANRGRLSADQSNPWLNFMFTGRQGMYGGDDQLGGAYANNPFANVPVGAAVTRAPEEFLALAGDNQQQFGPRRGRTNNMTGFAEGGRVGMRARLNQMRADRGMMPTGKVGALQQTQPLQAPRQLQNYMGSFAPQAPQNLMGAGMQGGAQAGFVPRGPVPGMPQMPEIPPGMAQAQVMPPPPEYAAQIQADMQRMAMPSNAWGQMPQNLMGAGMTAANPYAGALQGAFAAMNNRKNVVDPAFNAYAHGGYLHGGSSGQEDTVDARVSHGEYIVDADSVAALGDGNSEAGARELDQMIRSIRSHKRSAPASKIPPKSKGALAYMRRK